MTRHNTWILAGLVVAIALSSCDNDRRIERRAEREMERQAERRDDRQTRETRTVGDFDSIDIRGASRLLVSIGEKESLTVEGSAAALKRLQTRVDGDTLYIRTKDMRQWFRDKHRGGLTIRVTMPRLDSLNVEGGNDVQLSGFAGGDTRIKTEGATQVRAEGHVDELTVRMEGAGHADFRNLIADAARVTVSGVGSVYVHPKNSLDATMNGIGAILYSGSPRDVDTHMNGLGTISKHNIRDARRWDNRWHRHDTEEHEQQPVDPDTLQPEREDTKEPALEKAPAAEEQQPAVERERV
jgi:hypothetical protein